MHRLTMMPVLKPMLFLKILMKLIFLPAQQVPLKIYKKPGINVTLLKLEV